MSFNIIGYDNIKLI